MQTVTLILGTIERLDRNCLDQFGKLLLKLVEKWLLRITNWFGTFSSTKIATDIERMFWRN